MFRVATDMQNPESFAGERECDMRCGHRFTDAAFPVYCYLSHVGVIGSVDVSAPPLVELFEGHGFGFRQFVLTVHDDGSELPVLLGFR